MKLWMSDEIQADVGDVHRRARQDVENAINDKLSDSDYGSGVSKWAFISIIREEDSDDYGEIRRYDKRRKVVEFRLKIDHSQFKQAAATEQRKLLVASLLRSVQEMKEMGIPNFDVERLEVDVKSVAQVRGWAAQTVAESNCDNT